MPIHRSTTKPFVSTMASLNTREAARRLHGQRLVERRQLVAGLGQLLDQVLAEHRAGGVRRLPFGVEPGGAFGEQRQQRRRLLAHQRLGDGGPLRLRTEVLHALGHRRQHPVEVVAVLLHVGHRDAELIEGARHLGRRLRALDHHVADDVVEPGQRRLGRVRLHADLPEGVDQLLKALGAGADPRRLVVERIEGVDRLARAADHQPERHGNRRRRRPPPPARPDPAASARHRARRRCRPSPASCRAPRRRRRRAPAGRATPAAPRRGCAPALSARTRRCRRARP